MTTNPIISLAAGVLVGAIAGSQWVMVRRHRPWNWRRALLPFYDRPYYNWLTRTHPDWWRTS